MEERILRQSSDNISKLLSLMLTHEYNVRNHMRNHRNIDIQLVFDRLNFDLSQNFNFGDTLNENVSQPVSHDLSFSVTYSTFDEIENKNETVCPITQETFGDEDNVALLECGHYFKKDAFMVWARRSRSCPSCRAAFR